MLSTLVNTVFVVTLATRHVAAQLQILTPILTQCQDATLLWSGGQANYALYVLPSGDPCADSVVNFPEQTTTSFTWKNVSIPAGSTVELMVEDATLAEAWSAVITVRNSSDASCVDPKAAQALLVSNSLPQSSSSAASSSIAPSSATPTPATTVKISSLSYPSGAAKTVVPAANPSGLANAAGSGTSSTSSQPNSGLPRATLPASSLLGVAAFLFTMVPLS